jgi:hypothetical protein
MLELNVIKAAMDRLIHSNLVENYKERNRRKRPMKSSRDMNTDRNSSTLSLFELVLAVLTLVLVIALADSWAVG